MRKISTKKGFTLIELLVVVSIIALLASVVVAGLADARGGAKNNKRNELAQQYVITLGLYQGEYGEYPGQCTNCEDNTTRVCLGSGYPGGACYIYGEHNQNTTINTKLSEFNPSMPPSLESTVSGQYTFMGITYRCANESCLNYHLEWILEGGGSDSNCFGGATKTSLNSRVSLCTYSS